MMIAADGQEWLFFVMKVNPEPDKPMPFVLMENKEIVDSYEDPLEAARQAHELNQKEDRTFYFLEAKPVSASVPCEAEFSPS
jgi:hypothetical protein